MDWCELLVDYCDVLSAVWTLILTAPIHYRASIWGASDVMLHFSKSDEETNSSTSWMAWGRLNSQQIFIFVWTSPLTWNSWLVGRFCWVHFPQCISADWPGVPPSGSCCSLGPGSWNSGNRLSVCQSRSLLGLSSDFSRSGAFLGLYVKRRW